MHPVLLHRLHALPLLHLRTPREEAAARSAASSFSALGRLTDVAPIWSSVHRLRATETRTNSRC